MSEYELKVLGEICEFAYGKSLPKASRRSGNIPVYGSNGVDGYHDEALTSGPTIIVGRKGSAGAVNFSPQSCWPIDTTYYIDESCTDCDLTWLTFLIKRLELERLNDKGAKPGLNRDRAYALDVKVPPLADQKRIAARLSVAMEQIRSAQIAWREATSAASSLNLTELAFLFDDLFARHPKPASIGQVADIQTGYAFKSEWFSKDGIRLLRNANVSQGKIEWSDRVYLPVARRDEFSDFELSAGDIVLSLDRPLVNDGLKVSRLADTDVPSLLLQRVARFRGLRNVTPEYLYLFLNSPHFIASIRGHDQSMGVPHISPKQVAAVRLPLPPIEEQERITSRMNSVLKSIDAMCIKMAGQLAALDALPERLLAETFGEPPLRGAHSRREAAQEFRRIATP